MKNVVVIGTSNTILKNGYVSHLLKLQDSQDLKIDSIGIGDVSSLFGLFRLLENGDILRKADYCVFDFSMNEYIFIEKGQISASRVIFYLLGLLRLCQRYQFIPMFLLLSPDKVHTSNIQLYRQILSFFSVPTLDFDNIISERGKIDSDILYQSPSHYTGQIQYLLACEILNKIKTTKENDDMRRKVDHFFSQYPLEFRNLKDLPYIIENGEFVEKHTSILKETVLEMNDTTSIEITSDLIPIGVVFWASENGAIVQFESQDKRFSKNLSLKWKKGLFARSIFAYEKPVSKFKVSLNLSEEFESVHNEDCEFKTKVLQDQKFYLKDIIFTNKSPSEYVSSFYDFFLENEFDSLKPNLNS